MKKIISGKAPNKQTDKHEANISLEKRQKTHCMRHFRGKHSSWIYAWISFPFEISAFTVANVVFFQASWKVIVTQIRAKQVWCVFCRSQRTLEVSLKCYLQHIQPVFLLLLLELHFL